MTKRILCIFLAAAFLICTFTLPSYAAPADQTTYDLLSSGNVTYFDGPDSGLYTGSFKPAYKNIKFSWDVTETDFTLDYFSVFLSSSVRPSSFTCLVNGVQRSISYSGSLDDIYEYQIELGISVQSIVIFLVYSSAPLYVGLSKVEGYRSINQLAPYTYAYCYGMFNRLINDQGDYDYRAKLVDYQLVSYPWTHSNSSTILGLSTGVSWLYSTYYFDIQTNSLGLDAYDKLVVQFVTPNSSVIGDLALYERGGSDIVDTILLEKVETIDFYPMEGITINGVTVYNEDLMYYHKVTFDISGIDINNYTLDFNVTLAPRETGRLSSDINTYGYYTFIQLDGIYFIPDLSPRPWYVQFWNWLDSGIDRIVQAINGAPAGTDPLDQPGNELATQASEFNSAVDIIESVTKPSIDIESELEELPTPDPLVISTVQAMTGDQFLIKLLIMAALMALVGIVLYGGKD